MTEQHSDRETLDTAKGLTGALEEMSRRLAEAKEASEERDAELHTYGRRNRKWIVFDIAITIVLAVVSFIAVRAVASAHDAQVAAVAARAAVTVAEQDNRNLCLSSNVAREQQIELWTFVIDLGKGHGQTARQKENVARFVARLNVLFAPRDCSHVNPGKS